MHKISTASSASTVVASIISTDVLIFGVSSQHFPFFASLQNLGESNDPGEFGDSDGFYEPAD